MGVEDIKSAIESGQTVLGIELGSTRIKACLLNEDHEPIASGDFTWENRYENGIWTYHTEEIHNSGELAEKVDKVLSFDGPVICQVYTPIGLTAWPRQVSYMRKDGQMESKPLEYMDPPLPEDEFAENMLIPMFEEK